jgi:hypothetical protein
MECDASIAATAAALSCFQVSLCVAGIGRYPNLCDVMASWRVAEPLHASPSEVVELLPSGVRHLASPPLVLRIRTFAQVGSRAESELRIRATRVELLDGSTRSPVEF